MYNTVSVKCMLENKNTLIMIWLQLIVLSLKWFYTKNSFRKFTDFCFIKLRIFLTVQALSKILFMVIMAEVKVKKYILQNWK